MWVTIGHPSTNTETLFEAKYVLGTGKTHNLLGKKEKEHSSKWGDEAEKT